MQTASSKSPQSIDCPRVLRLFTVRVWAPAATVTVSGANRTLGDSSGRFLRLIASRKVRQKLLAQWRGSPEAGRLSGLMRKRTCPRYREVLEMILSLARKWGNKNNRVFLPTESLGDTRC